jgi:cycloeucalenol cycloisomerase
MAQRRPTKRYRNDELEPPIKPEPQTEDLNHADKLWTERLILLQTPLWVIAVGTVMISGILRQWNDLQYMLFSISVALPSFLLPLFSTSRPTRGVRPWYQAYWFKLQVWVAIVVFFGSYIGTAYFFDLMGMEYAFHVQWNFSSDVVGRIRQEVPLFMYPLTHAYFMSYFVILVAADRYITTRLGIKSAVGKALVVLCLSYVLALAETFFMAVEFFSDLFLYRDRARMLRLGSLGYATYFLVGLPMLRRMDSNGDVWTLGRTVKEAMAACMGILLLLEAWSKVIGPL